MAIFFHSPGLAKTPSATWHQTHVSHGLNKSLKLLLPTHFSSHSRLFFSQTLRSAFWPICVSKQNPPHVIQRTSLVVPRFVAKICGCSSFLFSHLALGNKFKTMEICWWRSHAVSAPPPLCRHQHNIRIGHHRQGDRHRYEWTVIASNSEELNQFHCLYSLCRIINFRMHYLFRQYILDECRCGNSLFVGRLRVRVRETMEIQ